MKPTPATIVAILAAGFLVAACHPPDPPIPVTTDPGQPTSAGLPAGDPNTPMPAPDTCTMRHEGTQPLPDPHCTPGATNPAITQANIAATICKTGWTTTVRPPESVTAPMKRASERSYGLPTSTRAEYDHLVPLELGGAPQDPRNLWPEPGAIPNVKDGVEGALRRAVCSGRVSLSAAQDAIAADWTTATSTLGISGKGQ